MLMSATFPDRPCLIRQAVSINLPGTRKGLPWAERNERKKKRKDLHAVGRHRGALPLIYLPTCVPRCVCLLFVRLLPWLSPLAFPYFFCVCVCVFFLFSLRSRDSYQWQGLDFAFKSELYIRRFPDSRRIKSMRAMEHCANILPHKRQFICIFSWHRQSEEWVVLVVVYINPPAEKRKGPN